MSIETSSIHNELETVLFTVVCESFLDHASINISNWCPERYRYISHNKHFRMQDQGQKSIITFVQLKPRKLYDYGLLLVFVNKLMLFLG